MNLALSVANMIAAAFPAPNAASPSNRCKYVRDLADMTSGGITAN